MVFVIVIVTKTWFECIGKYLYKCTGAKSHEESSGSAFSPAGTSARSCYQSTLVGTALPVPSNKNNKVKTKRLDYSVAEQIKTVENAIE